MAETKTRTTIHQVRGSASTQHGLGIQGLPDAPGDSSGRSRAESALAFDGLRRLVESLPLTTEEFGFATNWVESARQLWEQGEPGATRYQVDLVRKKFGL